MNQSDFSVKVVLQVPSSGPVPQTLDLGILLIKQDGEVFFGQGSTSPKLKLAPSGQHVPVDQVVMSLPTPVTSGKRYLKAQASSILPIIYSGENSNYTELSIKEGEMVVVKDFYGEKNIPLICYDGFMQKLILGNPEATVVTPSEINGYIKINGKDVKVYSLPNITKADIGLGNVNNTSDLDKPVSTATQLALDAKAPLRSPQFEGVPTAPTPDEDEATSQIATARFVHSVVRTAIQLLKDELANLPKEVRDEVFNLVQRELNEKANIESPQFTGKPLAVTQPQSDSSRALATTEYVRTAIEVLRQAFQDMGGFDEAARAKLDSIAEKATRVQASGINGYVLINGVAVKVYELPSLTKFDVGLGKVDNTPDAEKPLSEDMRSALSEKAPLTSPKFVGFPKAPTRDTTDSSENIATTQFVKRILEDYALSTDAHLNDELFTSEFKAKLSKIAEGATNVKSSAERGHILINGVDTAVFELTTEELDALDRNVKFRGFYKTVAELNTISSPSDGDFAIVEETRSIWMYLSILNQWVDSTGNRVRSVAGKIGDVTLNKGDVGLDYVDNTSDQNKPVSIAQQEALNQKANLDSPEFVGVPTAPTPEPGSANQRIATTAFVNDLIQKVSDFVPVKEIIFDYEPNKEAVGERNLKLTTNILTQEIGVSSSAVKKAENASAIYVLVANYLLIFQKKAQDFTFTKKKIADSGDNGDLFANDTNIVVRLGSNIYVLDAQTLNIQKTISCTDEFHSFAFYNDKLYATTVDKLIGFDDELEEPYHSALTDPVLMPTASKLFIISEDNALFLENRTVKRTSDIRVGSTPVVTKLGATYLVISAGNLYYSDDEGETWHKDTRLFPGQRPKTSIDSFTRELYIAWAGGLVRYSKEQVDDLSADLPKTKNYKFNMLYGNLVCLTDDKTTIQALDAVRIQTIEGAVAQESFESFGRQFFITSDSVLSLTFTAELVNAATNNTIKEFGVGNSARVKTLDNRMYYMVDGGYLNTLERGIDVVESSERGYIVINGQKYYVFTLTEDEKKALAAAKHNHGYFTSPEALREAYPHAEPGDYAIVGQEATVWVWNESINDWEDTHTTGTVNSVNGKTGDVVLTKEDIGLDQVDNTSDDNKPLSRASRAAIETINQALAKKADLDEQGIILFSQLPENVRKSLHYVGLWDALQNEPKLINNSPEHAGEYYIASVEGVQFGRLFKIGDWAVNVEGTWVINSNTSDVNSVAGKTGNVELAIADIVGLVSALNAKADKDLFDQHVSDKNNPHAVTAAQLGLGKVDNTSDLEKPVSVAQQTAINAAKDLLQQSISELASNFNLHSADKANPHDVTAEQVGLGNVDNTADSDKPVSIAQHAALDALRLEVVNLITQTSSSLSTHIQDKNNPHGVTAAQIGLDRVDNTNDLEKPISLATSQKIEEVRSILASGIEQEKDKLDLHVADKANPHEVTAEQVGLGKVQNLAPSEMPLSEAAEQKFNEVAAEFETVPHLGADNKIKIENLPDSILGNVKYKGLWDAATNNPHLEQNDEASDGFYFICNVPGSQFGYEFESGDWVINSAGNWRIVKNSNKVSSVNGKIGEVVIGISDIPGLNDLIATLATSTSLLAHTQDTSNPHAVTADQIGLGKVDNTSDLEKPVSHAQRAALDEITLSVSRHAESKSNPHEVTAAQVGLGKVDNTSDLEKPVSVAQQAALDAATEELRTLSQQTKESLNTHTADKNNPHAVTAAQLGLGKVDNTSDLEKPVSVAQQTAINAAKEEVSLRVSSISDLLTAHKQDKSNPHEVTAEQVGLGNVANLAPENLPISRAVEAELLKYALIADTYSKSQVDDLISAATVNAVLVSNTNQEIDGYKTFIKPVKVAQPVADEDAATLANVKAVKTSLDAYIEQTTEALSKKADLDENGKIVVSQLPDAVLGNLKFQGTWNAAINAPYIENSHPEDDGKYYIVQAPGTWWNIEFAIGDWVVNAKGSWVKIDNTGAVHSVNGKTGVVTLGIEDIPGLAQSIDDATFKVDEVKNAESPIRIVKTSEGKYYITLDKEKLFALRG
jgi:hypothetical protein